MTLVIYIYIHYIKYRTRSIFDTRVSENCEKYLSDTESIML